MQFWSILYMYLQYIWIAQVHRILSIDYDT